MTDKEKAKKVNSLEEELKAMHVLHQRAFLKKPRVKEIEEELKNLGHEVHYPSSFIWAQPVEKPKMKRKPRQRLSRFDDRQFMKDVGFSLDPKEEQS